MSLEQTNEELMIAYQNGDSAAFDILYQRVSGKVYGYLRKRLQRRDLVDDCFQMTFVKFHRVRGQYLTSYSVEQWLYVITKSVLMDHYRKESRSVPIDAEAFVEDIEQLGSSETLSEDSKVASVAPHLEILSGTQKKVIQWKVMEDMPYDEIAQRLNQSEANVRQIFSRSIRKLRSALTVGENKS